MPSSAPDATAALILAGIGALIVLYIWTCLGLAAMFRKMGEDPARGWVPVANIGTVLAWGGASPWWAVLLLVPGVGLIALIPLARSAARISAGFGYARALAVLAVLLFVVWASVLGFGPARWRGAHLRAHLDATAASAPGNAGAPGGLGGPQPVWEVPDPEPPVFAAHVRTESTERTDPPSPVPEDPPDGDDALWAPSGPASTAPVVLPRRRVPIDAVPAADDAEPAPSPAPAVRRTPPGDDAFPEASGEVSAVVGSPSAGGPRPARSAISAVAGLPPAEAGARTDRWHLVTASGVVIALTSDTVILGRAPERDAAGTQIIAVAGVSPTVSQTHARLQRSDGHWTLSDLGSTNGVALRLRGRTERAAVARAEVSEGDTFFLGDEPFTLRRR